MSAAISLDMGAYHYAQSLMAIGLMFQAASGSLAQQHAEIEQAKAEYDRHIEAGGEPIGEWEDGYCLWDQEKVYRLEQLAIEDALEELRVATAIAVYHIWERNIPNPLRKKRRTHAQLITDAGLAGVNLHPDIDALCFAANYFKHGTDTWRQKLLEHRSKRFRGDALTKDWDAEWVRRLHITDGDVKWFLELAKVSQRPISSPLSCTE